MVMSSMTHQLTADQVRRLESEVAAGRFASVADAVEAAIVGLLTAVDEDSEAIGPLLDEARQSLARGEGISLDEFKARTAARRAANSGKAQKA